MTLNLGDDRELNWEPFLERYRRGEWRAPIFCDMILADMQRLGPPRSLTLLDIGCGKGFDDDMCMQEKLAAAAHQYIGVEPDEAIKSNPIVQRLHRCRFEEVPLEPCSIDVAFAVMVLEHLEHPDRFWRRLHEILANGGVFWGFTIDSRNWFAKVSLTMKKMGIKDWYLSRVCGCDGENGYKNYPVYYRCNTPSEILQWTTDFRSKVVLNLHRIGQLDYYIPRPLRWLGRRVDRYIVAQEQPGSVMAMRIVK